MKEKLTHLTNIIKEKGYRINIHIDTIFSAITFITESTGLEKMEGKPIFNLWSSHTSEEAIKYAEAFLANEVILYERKLKLNNIIPLNLSLTEFKSL